MAKYYNKASKLLTLVVVLSIFLLISSAESRIGRLAAQNTVVIDCNAVYGVQEADTCDGIIQGFKLDAGFFGIINPNINCDAIFVGQWVCVNGIVD